MTKSSIMSSLMNVRKNLTHRESYWTVTLLHIADEYARRIIRGGKDNLSRTQVDQSTSYLQSEINNI